MKTSRQYVQRSRAEAAEASRTAVLDAFLALVFERASVAVSLADIADRAGVTVQTILRKFGSRDQLFEETLRHGQAVVGGEREAPTGDPALAVAILVEHYETRGAAVLALLAAEDSSPTVARIVATGRETHRDWVRQVFGPELARVDDQERDDFSRLLGTVTDIDVWRMLRRDQGLSRSETERHLLRLVRSLLESFEVSHA